NATKLAIFESVLVDGEWQQPVLSSFNDTESNSAHPAYSSELGLMVFSSDREGSVNGEADLWLSRWVNDSWTTPEPLEHLNSSATDCFPYIDGSGNLYFSSNRNGGLGGFDIYRCFYENGEYTDPILMAQPINSTSDDYGLAMNIDGESGYFSSNRHGLNDDIYSFTFQYPEFNNCQESEEPFFCYLIEENNIIASDTLPLIYEWDFGDGTTGRGLSTTHCYDEYGEYEVYLNVYDSISQTSFAKVSETYIDIQKPDFPLIQAPDSIAMGDTLNLVADISDFEMFEIDKLFWTLPDGTRVKGHRVEWIVDQTPLNFVVGGLSRKDQRGYMRTCSQKQLYLVDSEESIAIANQKEKERKEREYQPLSALNKRGASTIENIDLDKHLVVYFVEITTSTEQIPLSDPFFENVDYEITERYVKRDSSYHYSVGEVTEITALYKIYKDLLAKGYEKAVVMDDSEQNFDGDFVKRGMYFPEEVKAEMNKEMDKLSDIHFDYNSTEISVTSFTNLNTVVEVLMLNPEIELMIHAHTDDQGTAEYNNELSVKRAEAVVDYLTAMGIDSSRLQFEGHGNAEPIASNDSDEGRALNRRVEFEILFEIMEGR
ncbi:MAG: OmpA family protein, partial [Flavobacteriales bacterium]|nr:OmpA family protein [Flavobacteriales bacterium]